MLDEVEVSELVAQFLVAQGVAEPPAMRVLKEQRPLLLMLPRA